MKDIRRKAIKYIFDQKQKAQAVSNDETFDASMVDVSNIVEDC